MTAKPITRQRIVNILLAGQCRFSKIANTGIRSSGVNVAKYGNLIVITAYAGHWAGTAANERIGRTLDTTLGVLAAAGIAAYVDGRNEIVVTI